MSFKSTFENLENSPKCKFLIDRSRQDDGVLQRTSGLFHCLKRVPTGSQSAFGVATSAPIHPIAFPCGKKRICRHAQLGGSVHVRFEDYGAAALTFQLPDDIGPAFEDTLNLKRNVVLREEATNVVSNGCFPWPTGIARIDTIDGNQICKCLEHCFWVGDESHVHRSCPCSGGALESMKMVNPLPGRARAVRPWSGL